MKKAIITTAVFFAVLFGKSQSVTPDPDFGNNGLLIKTGAETRNMSRTVLRVFSCTDGKMLFVMIANDICLLSRRLANGSADLSYGSSGFSRGTISIPRGVNVSAAMQPDGKVVIAFSQNSDFALGRFNEDGSLNTSFGSGGIVNTDAGGNDLAFAVVVQPDGKIVSAGRSNQQGILGFTLMRHNSDGTLDASFGANGIITALPGNIVGIRSISILPNGKIITVGNAPGLNGFAVSRNNADGSLDATFGLNGTVTTSFTNYTAAWAGAIQADGKILVGGTAVASNGSFYRISRYTADGVLDSNYNSTGTVDVFFSTTEANLASMVLQSDGKLLAAGAINENTPDIPPYLGLVRFNEDGSIDSSFANQGKLLGNLDASSCIAVQSDGKIITGGRSFINNYYDFAITRFNADGTADPSFGDAGALAGSFPFPNLYYIQPFLQNSGKLLVLGNGNNGITSVYSYFLQRFNANGTVDSAYGENGLATINGNCAAALPGNKMIVAGSKKGTSTEDIVLTRYNDDGTIDSSFGAGAMITTDFGDNEYPVCIAVQSDHKIIVSGRQATGPEYADWLIVRYNSDGTLDNTFGSGGKVTTDFEKLDDIQQMVLGSDGKILVAGTGYHTRDNDFNNYSDALLARYNIDGSPDESFGQGGKKIIDFNDIDAAGSLVIQKDGNILLSKIESNFTSDFTYVLARYTSSGNIDSAFGINGKIITSGLAAALQEDQKILVGGSVPSGGSASDFSLSRFNADGSPDLSFDNDGKIITSFTSGYDQPYILTLSGNRLFVSGYSSYNNNALGVIAKYIVDTQSHTIVLPIIHSFWPQTAVPGSTVAISGAHFDPVAANNIVYFGAVKATVNTATDTSLTVTVPFGATYQPITVTTNNLIAYSILPFIPTTNEKSNITPGSFSTESHKAGHFAEKLVTSDLDGDGKSDLITANNGSVISILKNTSTVDSIKLELLGNYESELGDHAVAVGDLNRDGRPDLVVSSSYNSTISFYLNTSSVGAISFAPRQVYQISPNSGPTEISISDLDGDGRPDIVFINNSFSYPNTVSILRNTSSGGNISFGEKVDYSIGLFGASVSVGDLNNDGKPDIVAVSNNEAGSISILRNRCSNGIISFDPPLNYEAGGHLNAVSLADMDRDDKLDLVIKYIHLHDILVFRNLSSADSIKFEEGQHFSSGLDAPLGGFSIGDLNGDDKPDIAICKQDSIAICENNSTAGAISLKSGVAYHTGAHSVATAIVDLNNDGKPDLAATDYQDILILRNHSGEQHTVSVKIINPANDATYPAGSTITLQASAVDSGGQITKVEFYNAGVKFAEDLIPPFELTANGVEAGNYVLTAKAFNNNGDSAISDTIRIVVTSCAATGQILAEGYGNIPGKYVTNLTSNPRFPSSPDVTALLSKFEYGQDIADNYGARVRGYLCAPLTGNYIFYIASDEQSELWLSTDDNAAHKIKIAYLNSPVPFRAWNTYSTQKSIPIRLIKGVRYYIETLHKESTGTDHLSVGWILPNGTGELPIPGNRLISWDYAQPLAPSFGGGMQNIQQGLTVTAGPNPSSGYFILTTRSSHDERISITVTDVLGKTVEKQLNLPANGTIQFGSNFGPGMYFVEIIQGTEKKRIKLIRQ